MWKRKALKKNTIASLKVNYWRMIAVCFLIAMLTTAYTSSTAVLNQYGPDTQMQDNYPDASSAAGLPNSEVIMDTFEQITDTKNPVFFSSPSVHTVTDYLIDMYTSGRSVSFSILRAVNSILDDHFNWSSVFLAAGAIAILAYQFFAANILLIGERRFFLEARNYHQTRISKIFFLYKLRYLRNPAWIMFCRNIFQWLWNLTIIGGFIKHYEYIMIPFILAENPAAKRSEAFQLSRQLMHGNKWKMFLLHLSFLGWQILAFLTFGILGFTFVNPYMTGTDAELYMKLRKNYISCRASGYELFQDSLLEYVPSEDELLISKALYDDSQGPYTKISYFAPEQYPAFLYSIQPPRRAVKAPMQAGQKYNFLSCVFLFFAFSIFGWILESFIHLLLDGTLPGRGFLLGPWLPLYGLCGLILLVLIRMFSQKPLLVFLMIMAVYALIEYLINWILEYEWDIILTDYTGYFLNLDGRTFLGGAIFFAMIGCAFLYYLAPCWNESFHRFPAYIQAALCILLCVLFTADLLYTLLHPELLSGLLKPELFFMKS